MYKTTCTDVLLILLLVITGTVTQGHGWTFTDKDYQALSPIKKERLDTIYYIGETKGYGLKMASKGIVENGLNLTDNNKNRICGILQVDYTLVDATCEQLESSVYISAHIALQEYIKWKTQKYCFNKSCSRFILVERSDDLATMMYNSGYMNDSFRYEYLRRIKLVEEVLKNYY